MSTYYSDELVTLHHGDCLTLNEWLQADVLVTDPPYGVSYRSGWVKRDRSIQGDESTAIRDAAIRAWGAGRPALIFGAWNVPRPTLTRHRLIWFKGDDPGMGDLKFPWGKSDEEIYVLGTGFQGKRGPNVLRCNKQSVSNRDDHPTPKPVALMEALITRSPPGVIADPFAGSGSTLVAAKALGRKAIGVEVEERYCEIIANRLAQGAFDFGGAS